MDRKAPPESAAAARIREAHGPDSAPIAAFPAHRRGASRERDDVLADTLDAHFHEQFRETSYYSSGRDWDDYAPAYRYGYATRDAHRHSTFEEAESVLAEGWDQVKDVSRLCWAEARGAVEDAWRSVDLAGPQARRHLGTGH